MSERPEAPLWPRNSDAVKAKCVVYRIGLVTVLNDGACAHVLGVERAHLSREIGPDSGVVVNDGACAHVLGVERAQLSHEIGSDSGVVVNDGACAHVLGVERAQLSHEIESDSVLTQVS
ncbi:hypothetical protein AVEN_177514-1 [Araneus ventricosus]|uniref:Uncharacterized protein n=1 Tax=Araneus ventricosus TaxID=182803 RepID=A0A4Y2D0G7_ARAVE|nr:hypothetical protein AVEN_177514-1 [Araneus ventricosus]